MSDDLRFLVEAIKEVIRSSLPDDLKLRTIGLLIEQARPKSRRIR